MHPDYELETKDFEFKVRYVTDLAIAANTTSWRGLAEIEQEVLNHNLALLEKIQVYEEEIKRLQEQLKPFLMDVIQKHPG